VKPLAGSAGMIVGVLLLLALWPAAALAQDQCAAGQPPRIDGQFQALVDQLGARVGDAADCAHSEATTGDLQQHTAGGLLYLRQRTGTPTFTDGAEHWALRAGQVLAWTSDDVDPPPNAQFATTAAPTQAAPAPAPGAPVATVPAGLPDIGGLLVAASISCTVLVLLAILGLVWLRRRPGSPVWVVQPGTQLATATASVTALQGSLHDVGAGRITDQARDILGRDAEPMVWQERPLALAVLVLAILKWVLVLIVAVSLAIALGQLAFVAVPLAVAALALGRRYASLSGTSYRASSQRLEITTGLASERKVTWELHELGDALIVQPLHYRLFGVGDLTVQHRSQGPITLAAIRNPELVRDLVRGSGQFEAARWDRIRLR